MNIRSKILGTTGQCIYCGATDRPLHREHIVPYGLNGEWILRRASCLECAKIISKIELQILHIELSAARAALNFPTRRKDKRPRKFPVVISRGGKEEIANVSLLEHPTTMTLPIFELPAYLDKRSYEKGIDVSGVVTIQVGGPPLKQIAEKYDTDTLLLKATLQPVAFARLLAKIAYGFAVANYGLGMFEEVYVLPAILGESDDIGRWVGHPTDNLISAGKHLHEIKLSVTKGEILAHVRLFLPFNAPEYLVVVGRLRPLRKDSKY